VDETAAQSVFALASRSVVSINDYSRDVLEGVGTGVVWDVYGHSESRPWRLLPRARVCVYVCCVCALLCPHAGQQHTHTPVLLPPLPPHATTPRKSSLTITSCHSMCWIRAGSRCVWCG
jgi:hypothetical protein